MGHLTKYFILTIDLANFDTFYMHFLIFEKVFVSQGFSLRMGKFIIVDGIDGCGKSTISRLLCEALEEKRYSCYLTAEPSTGPIGKLIRRYLQNRDEMGQTLSVDALLFAADRVEHVTKEVDPNLATHDFVVSDRYTCSSIAYQAVQMNIDHSYEEIQWVETINKHAPKADLYLILDIVPEKALARKEDTSDKFETIDFLSRVRALFLDKDLMGKYAENYIIIPSTGGPEGTLAKVLKTLENLKWLA